MYLHRLSVSAREIRRGSGKNNRVRKKPTTLKVAVDQNLFLHRSAESISQMDGSMKSISPATSGYATTCKHKQTHVPFEAP